MAARAAVAALNGCTAAVTLQCVRLNSSSAAPSICNLRHGSGIYRSQGYCQRSAGSLSPLGLGEVGLPRRGRRAVVSAAASGISLPNHLGGSHSIEEDGAAAAAEGKPLSEHVQSWFERRVLNSRFLTLSSVVGSLAGSALCFLKGSILIVESIKYAFKHFFSHTTSREILYLVEALDVYLMGTVMLIFALGIYELFIESLTFPPESDKSCFFGLFPLRSRPKWLAINSLDEMKTKLGHVIVMILLVGIFEKSKKVIVTNATELFLFSGSVALAAACLILLSRLHAPDAHSNGHST